MKSVKRAVSSTARCVVWKVPSPDPGKEIWLPRKIEIKVWVKDWSTREMTGLDYEQVMKLLTELESILPEEVNDVTGWTYTRDQGSWSKKTMISLWFLTTAGEGR